ncbi:MULTISPECIES: hypothetical protein [unclassified Microcoleus]|uniref:hypothetical protein n=1 Tax=unclassified Microcoleus TaxID=2642155 RepID=UPI002FD513B1
MKINPKSLTNLKPGVNKKGTGAIRVTLTLKPETVKLLRMTGNMSVAVDKFIELIKQGCVSHDGMLNPIPSRSEAESLQSQHTHSVTDAIADAKIYGFTPEEALADAQFQINMLQANHNELEGKYEAVKRELEEARSQISPMGAR